MREPEPGIARVGDRIGSDLSVLGIVDGGSVEPVYIVWHHRAWCPMACKVYSSWRGAEREAQVLASFAHPNIVRVLEVGRPRHLLMPFLEGSSLGMLIERAKSRQLAVADALRIAMHVGSALQHIHDRGYLHLDIKPDNVIVARGGLPILFDLGSARRQDAPRPRDVIGTDPYIAPEECRLGKAGPAADVFGLGVTLYEMLTGELPFPKGAPENPFPQLSAEPAPLRKHRRSISAKLESLILACLERNPASRPTLQALLPALNDMIRSGPRMWPENFRPDAVERTGNAPRTPTDQKRRAGRLPVPARSSAPAPITRSPQISTQILPKWVAPCS
jgi:serine/threonine protein kinase